MHCLVIDDNPKTSSALTALLENCTQVGHVFHGVNAFMVGTLMAAEKIDVILTRVRLWDPKIYMRLNTMPAMVFLSGGKNKLTLKPGTAVKYSLREPYFASDLAELFHRIAAETQREAPDFMFLRYDGRFHKTMFSDIELIERKEGSYVQFHLSYGSWLIPGTLPAWLGRLPADRFIRVCDQLIVPASELPKITTDEFEYKGRSIRMSFRFEAGARNENASTL